MKKVEIQKWKDRLFSETVNIKEEYIADAISNARIRYQHSENYIRRLDIKPNTNEYLLFLRCKDIVAKGLDALIEDYRNGAERTYEFAIAKLSYRLLKKKLTVEQITHIDPKHIDNSGNLEIDIEFGLFKMSCYSVLARGNVQDYHIRYLIKKIYKYDKFK